MKVLITGANGLIGGYLAKKYSELGHSIIGIDNFSNSSYEEIQDVKNFKLYEADVSNFELMKHYCEGVDIIIHCACMPFEGFSNVSPNMVSRSVFDTTVSIASAGAANNVKKFFNFSSMARYGNNPNLPFQEEYVPTPSDPYGVAKVASENMLNTMSEIYGFKVMHIVPHNVFGCRSKWDDPRRGVLNIFINQALQELPMTIHNTGEQRRSFSFVEDAFSFAEELLNYDFKNKEVLNVGPDASETYLSINELAQIVKEETKSKSKFHYETKLNEVEEAWCSSDKVRKLFNWESKVEIREEIKKIISHIQKRGVKPFNYNYYVEIERFCPKSWLKR